MPILHLWEEIGLREFYIFLLSYELRQRKDRKVRVSTLVILFILLGSSVVSHRLGVKADSALGPGKVMKEGSKTFRVFFTDQSYYRGPIRTISPTLWKKKITLPWMNYALRATKITWGGENGKNLMEGRERSRSISQNATEQVVQTVGPVVYFTDWHVLELFLTYNYLK